ncbi:ABC transporter permease [Lentilactobacillus kosonis]|uniref:ABC transporter, permease protein EscB n=1 Tax=Lentilactobacillus kosonis TaxID=2810561 RepID=A0A401FKL7_9LACO|nr:ABC transporter permease [Lentilactobacillus kosonis]GAY72818.1 ABC transporter, permease protein EscB [Lentilactobacillus kosonis]
MNSLFRTRLSTHLTEMLKYLRLVFNDYFVLALMFMVGGLGYYYSGILNDLRQGTWWAPLLMIIVFTASLQLGRLATLIEDPDYVFWLPKEAEMYRYFRAGFRYSLIIAIVVQVIAWFISIPFMDRTIHVQAGFLLATLILLKITWLLSDFIRKFKVTSVLGNRMALRLGLPLIALLVSFYTNAIFGTVISAICLLGLAWYSRKLARNVAVNWQTTIADENSRMHTIYSFFNLFTDVKSMNGSVKRRRYLDWLVNRIQLKSENTYLYLYAHGIIRDTEMSGLFVRLTVIGLALLLFVSGTWLPVILAVLFIYLIGFQLVPFYYHFDNNAFVHIYPIDQKNQLRSFQIVIRNMLVVTAGLFVIAVAVANFNNWLTIISVIIAEVVELVGFIYWYVPSRLRRAATKR